MSLRRRTHSLALRVLLPVLLLAAAQSRAQATSPSDTASLELIRLDRVFPDPVDLPSFGKLTWKRLKYGLSTDVVHAKDRAVSGGFYFLGYIRLQDSEANVKKQLAQAEDYAGRIHELHQGGIQKQQGIIDFAERQLKKPHSAEKQKQYSDMLQQAQAARAAQEKAYPETVEAAASMVDTAKKMLSDLEAKGPNERMWHDLTRSSILNVTSGIRYMEDPDAWLKFEKENDPLFQGARSAGVGEYSIVSPKEHFYSVRFKRDHYVVSLMVTRGLGEETFDVDIHTAGKRIAEAFDAALVGDIPGILTEKNQSTKNRYGGLVTDGSNTLAISVYLPEAAGSLTVGDTKIGGLKQLSGDRWETVRSGVVQLDGEGKASLQYQPTEYLRDEALFNRSMYIHPDRKTSVPCAEEVLKFAYRTKDGKDETVDLPIRVFKPTVVLVHGFTGDLNTWKVMDGALARTGWDTHRGVYYSGDEGIADQSKLLKTNISGIRTHYDLKDIKPGKVDIVAHSMGGLISRYHISCSGTFEGEVRKLIMVATPNHGCSLTEKYIGNAASLAGGKAHWKASDELHGESTMIQRLNRGETLGHHLAPGVEYAILYGQRHNYKVWYTSWTYDGFFPNDGVVSVDSAVLNGVRCQLYNGVVHTGGPMLDIYPKDKAICEYVPVIFKVRELLLSRIPQPDLLNSLAFIAEPVGTVEYMEREWKPARKGADVRRAAVRTGKGSTTQIQFHIGGWLYGTLYLEESSEVRVFNASSRYVRIYIYKGKARYVSKTSKDTTVFIEAGRTGNDLKFYPVANVYHLDTDLEVSIGKEDVSVYSRDGRVGVQYWDADGDMQGKLLASGEGVTLVDDVAPADIDAPLTSVKLDGSQTPSRSDTSPALPTTHPDRLPQAGTGDVRLVLSDDPVSMRAVNTFAPDQRIHGRISWTGRPRAGVAQVLVVQQEGSESSLLIPLVVEVSGETHFEIPDHPAGRLPGRRSVEVHSGGTVVARASFMIQAQPTEKQP